MVKVPVLRSQPLLQYSYIDLLKTEFIHPMTALTNKRYYSSTETVRSMHTVKSYLNTQYPHFTAIFLQLYTHSYVHSISKVFRIDT